MPFHLCDWLCAGRREDITNLFDIPDYPEEEFAQWFKTRPLPEGTIYPSWSRYANESYIIYNFVRKFLPVSFAHSYDTSNNNVELSEKIIASNFIIYNNEQLGVASYKHVVLDKPSRYWMYTYFDWVNLYNKYCLPDGKVLNINPYENAKNWFFFHYPKLFPLLKRMLPHALLRPLYRRIKMLKLS
jgi:hypothetical protein